MQPFFNREHLGKNLPNYLTYLRLLIIPVFVYCMHDPSAWSLRFATLLFMFAVITDWMDGFIARRLGAESDFGKLLDPLADKILMMAALVMLASLRSEVYGDPWVPGWVVVLVLSREIWVTGLRGMAATQGLILPAGGYGKIKAAFQNLAVLLLLLHETPVSFLGWRTSCEIIGLNLIVLSLGFSYVAAVDYTTKVLGRISSDPVETPQTGE